MNPLLIALLSGLGFILAYHTYGRWLGRKIFRLSAEAVCPSVKLNDGEDFVPTPKAVVFGHHFTSIAGTGPIVGPAIAILWGWLPALLWVVFGSIFIGAVHDFGALVVSMRNHGQTVGDIAGRLINRRVRLLFLFVLVMALTVVLAIFGMVIGNVFKAYPASIFPCMVQIPLSMLIGWLLYRRGAGLLWSSISVLVVMYLTVFFGDWGPLRAFNEALAGWSVLAWVVFLLIYAAAASVMPVWILLQPRDYINSLQLLSALGLVILGLAVAAWVGGAPGPDSTVRPPLEMVAPMINLNPPAAPAILPFLFITIACGAISGFHCLVSSGTSSKQITSETDAQFIGYGSMLTEGFLAVLVILACAAGLGLGIDTPSGFLTGTEAWEAKYTTWAAVGTGALGAFVEGSANFLQAMGISENASIALMGVLVASFAGTTMDTACRLQRYVVQELAATLSGMSAAPAPARAGSPLAWLQDKYGATFVAIALAALLAALPVPGQAWTWEIAGSGGLVLWPLFGATNQLLGGLSFLVITFYLWRRKLPVWFLLPPAIFMLLMPGWAMVHQLFVGDPGVPRWWGGGNWMLVGIAVATLALEVWMFIEAFLLFPKARGVLERDAIEPEAAPAES
jgi:carbon starvation protein